MENTNKAKTKIAKSTVVIWILLVIIVLMIISGVYFYFQEQKKAQQVLNSDMAEAMKTVQIQQGMMLEKMDAIPGTVRPAQSVALSWQAAGIVGPVKVKDGDTVKKGDILASLDPASINAAILEAAVTKEQKQIELERLFTSTLNTATAYSNMVNALNALNESDKALVALGVVRKDQQELGVYYQDYLEAKQYYQEALNEYNTLKVRPLDDVDRQIAAEGVAGARTAMESTLSKYNWYSGEVDSLKKQQAEADYMLKSAEYDDAVRAYDRVKNGPTPAQIQSLQSEIDAAQAVVNTANLIAPIDGTIINVNNRQYDKIQTKDLTAATPPVAIQLDDLSSYYVDISVSEMKVNSLSVGQDVQISFEAVPLKTFTGKITHLSNTGKVTSGEVTFAATVKMDTADELVRPGMRAKITIIVQKIDNALYLPLSAVSTNSDGVSIVTVRNADGTTNQVPVETGIESEGNIQIISDKLKAGDEVLTYSMDPMVSAMPETGLKQP